MSIEETDTKVATPAADGAPDRAAAAEPVAGASAPGAPASAAPAPARRTSRFSKLWQVLRAGVGVWIGLFVAAAGFGLIAFTWSKVAALVNVALQVPYLLSGGFVGLGLVMLGLLVVNLAVKRKEAFDRHRQLEEVREALVRLREAIEEPAEEEADEDA
jgi:hypothetical protein